MWHPHVVLIEDKSSGQSVIQTLQRESRLPIQGVKVDRDKVSRANAAVGLIENGKVFLAASAAWLDDYLDELSSFPAGAHDDWTDATTQCLNYFRLQGDGAGTRVSRRGRQH